MINAAFADAMGLVTQTGIVRQQALLGRHLFPSRASRWVREIQPVLGITESRREDGGLDSRYWELRLSVTFRIGTVLEVGAKPNDERLLSLGARASTGARHDGAHTVEGPQLHARLNPHPAGSLGLMGDRISLPGGTATTTLVTPRTGAGFTTHGFLNAIVQYNSATCSSCGTPGTIARSRLEASGPWR